MAVALGTLMVTLFSSGCASTDVRPLKGCTGWVMPVTPNQMPQYRAGEYSLTAQIGPTVQSGLHARRVSIFSRVPETDLDIDGENSDVDTLSIGFEYRCCARSTSSSASSTSQARNETYRQVAYEESSAQPSATVAKAVALENLDPVESDKESSTVEVVTYSPEEEVVVTAPAPVHPMKIAIQEGCNVVSVKVIDESEVCDLFCPSTLKRITVTI